ncbi:MAG: GatB/YqeY domain-containing protein [Acidimicrobiia bacterium]
MTIREELAEQLKQAMRERDRWRLDVIRQVETEVSVAKSAPGFSGRVDDDLYRRVIASYVKQMDKARREYEELGERGRAMADKLAFEIDFLSTWLPTKAGEEETRAEVRRAIEELGVTDPKAAGQVIGHLMRTRSEQLDGALVNRIVREELTGGFGGSEAPQPIASPHEPPTP